MVYLVKKGIKVYYQSKSIDEIKALKKSLTFVHPNFYHAPSFKSGHWDGSVKFYNSRGNYFLHGMLPYVTRRLTKKHIKYSLDGFAHKDVSWVKFGEYFIKDDRDYGRDAILQFLSVGSGIIKVPTRGGKTFIASEIIRLLRQKEGARAMFVTDAVDLFSQAINDISKVLKVPKEEIGQIRGDKFELKDVTVAMIQTLQSNMKKTVARKERRKQFIKYLNSIDILLIDEVQEYSSKPRMNVIRRCENIKYMCSISATPFKKNSTIESKNIEAITGGIIYEVQEKKLIENKVLAQNKALLFLMEHRQYKEKLEYRDLYDKIIVNNHLRNEVILGLLGVCKKLKLKILVIFSSIKHGFLMEKLSGTKFICGENSDEERKQAKQKFITGKGNALLVSHIWKKGITISECEVLLNASGGKEESLILQIRGRVLGATKDKERALCIDFIDSYGDYFGEHSLERILAYESRVGKKNIDVLDTEDENFFNDLEEYLIDWFKLNIQK